MTDKLCIDTFDIQECSYEMKGSLLCVTCTLSAESSVDAFIASVLHINNLKSSILKLPKAEMTGSDSASAVRYEGCFSVVENGTYVLSIYDWNDAGEINIRPAVVEKLIVSQVTILFNTTPTQSTGMGLASETMSTGNIIYFNYVYLFAF